MGDVTLPPTRRPRKSTGHSPVRKRMEKENITVDVASSLAGNAGRKKSRSKSMGPGGLDVLKSGSGNRRVSLAAPVRPPPRSILKPTIPLLPEIPPHKPKSRLAQPSANAQGAENMHNPFQNEDYNSSGTKIALRTEEEQQAAAREREEKERKELEKEIKDRREARRKSLANRRVSFAAEATLHTFHEVEESHDSTTSTDSTRRASSYPSAPDPTPEPTDPPSTPPEQVEEPVPETPEHQRDLHQKKNRRSSALPPMSFNNGDDDHTIASTIYSSDSDATDGGTEIHEEIHSDDGSDSDVDGTTMDLVVDEVTGTSVASGITARSMSPDETNNTLDDALRLATRQAQTQSIDEEEEIIPSFGWARKPAPKKDNPERQQPSQSYRPYNGPNEDTVDQSEMDMDMDMDFTNAMGGILNAANAPEDDIYDDEMSMDVTRALGGILPQQVAQPMRKSSSPQQPGDASSTDDTTMDLTMAIGAIRQNNNVPDFEVESNADYEDMSMELTSVMGAVLPSGAGGSSKRKSLPSRRRTLTTANDETMMDMTVGMGRILPAAQAVDDEDEDENLDEATMGMDMTMAMGGIIKGASPVKDRAQAKHMMEEEVDRADSTPILTASSPRRRLSAGIGAPAPSEKPGTGVSPFRVTGLRRSISRRPSDVSNASSPIRQLSPSKQTGTVRESSPLISVQSSPLRTPSPGKPSSRTPSPQRSATARGSLMSKSPFKSPFKNSNIFQQNPSTGVSTPRVVLTPQPRRVSGVGADRSGLGSPKVAALFDRRESIGDSASKFVPGRAARGVTFADPRIIEVEIDNERRAEEDRENGRSILEREADGGDDENTATLKDMIASMSPKKNNQFRGRKSLHVGSARGLLGKRPSELDDEDEEDRDGVKRLKGHQGSPVKNVHLHAPPTVAETTGRLTRSVSRTLEETGSHNITPSIGLSPLAGSGSAATSPRHQRRFKRVENDQPTDTFNFEEPPRPLERDLLDDDDEERIHLQDFLNMTSIRFMELTTTKRRHTQAPAALKDSTLQNADDVSLERCVVAGACTVPMLELYQHSCRELKKYISEGRRIVREIETETFDENPPLFKEYISATPDFKLLMDNQFKNVKTHARLLSKAMWYEWRMKLQDGLKEGLVTIAKDMEDDEQLLQKQENMLNVTLPQLLKAYEALEQEHGSLQSIAQEIAKCDPEELEAARAELSDVDSDVAEKMRKIEELQQILGETESTIQDMANRKQECLAAIEEAEKIREECRGWSSKEISTLKVKVDEIEKEHGWTITGISGTMVSMTYRREIEVAFDIGAFQDAKTTSQVNLSYIAANREKNPQPKTVEKDFFVQCIRDYVRGLVQTRMKISTLLRAIGAAWDKADAAADNIRLLNCTFPTEVARTSDSSLVAKIDMLLVPLETKVQLSMGLQSQPTPDGIEFSIVPTAQVVYGEHFKIDKVCEYLSTRLGERVTTKKENEAVESWSDVIVELHERLVARGRK
ncbi:Spc7-domain-containing protein [Apiospora arundinis]|uniref:Spc7-domain-containing protein n=1 Tax=Apiospora arundinis TaxID=335852 RepID=A0ABR2HR70_9PEZI